MFILLFLFALTSSIYIENVRASVNPNANKNNAQCLIIDKIIINGVSVVSSRDIQKIAKQYTGQCFKSKNFQELLRKITNYYAEQGYITTLPSIPEQNIQSGTLIIQVKEGFIEDIESNFANNKLPFLLPVKRQQILSLRDIEQAYDYFSKIKSNDVNIVIKPGKSPNSSILVIDNNPGKKWNLSIGADNSGSKRQPVQMYNTLSLENLLGLNEQYGFNFRQSVGEAHKKYSNSKGFNFSMPVDYYDFSFNYGVSKDRNLVESVGNYYVNRGTSKTYQVNVNKLLHRDGFGKTHASIGLAKDIYTNHLDEEKIQISSYKINKVDVGISHNRRLYNSVISLALNITKGINKGFYSTFENIQAPVKNFTKANLDISWIKPLSIALIEQNIQYRLQCSSQYSANMLAGSEKYSLTGLNAVRGFKEFKETAETAFFVRNELHVPIFNPKSIQVKRAFGEVSIFTGFDYGYFSNYEEEQKRKGVLSSFAVGLKNSDRVFNFSVTLASPFHAPKNYKYENTLYVNLGVSI